MPSLFDALTLNVYRPCGIFVYVAVRAVPASTQVSSNPTSRYLKAIRSGATKLGAVNWNSSLPRPALIPCPPSTGTSTPSTAIRSIKTVGATRLVTRRAGSTLVTPAIVMNHSLPSRSTRPPGSPELNSRDRVPSADPYTAARTRVLDPASTASNSLFFTAKTPRLHVIHNVPLRSSTIWNAESSNSPVRVV